MRTSVNTGSKKIRAQMAEGCGPSPLCAPCKFSKKRVPAVWRDALPGTPYASKDPLIGTEVILRGDTRPSTIVSAATPIGPSLLQLGRVSQRRQCEGAVIVKTPLGIRTPVTRSVVRERKRLAKPERAVCTCGGLPYPHRVASSPLCTQSDVSLEALADLSRDAYEGGERDEARFIAAARKAGGRKSRVSSVDEAARLFADLQRGQEELYHAADKRRMEPKSVYKKRLSDQRAMARKMGWSV